MLVTIFALQLSLLLQSLSEGNKEGNFSTKTYYWINNSATQNNLLLF